MFFFGQIIVPNHASFIFVIDRIHITRSQMYHSKKSYFSTMILFLFCYCLFHQAFIVSITCVSSVSVIIYGTIAYMMFEKGLANTPFL